MFLIKNNVRTELSSKEVCEILNNKNEVIIELTDKSQKFISESNMKIIELKSEIEKKDTEIKLLKEEISRLTLLSLITHVRCDLMERYEGKEDGR